MQSKVFDSALMAIFDKTSQSLSGSGQVNNLRVFLVGGYHDRFYTAKTNTKFIDIIYG